MSRHKTRQTLALEFGATDIVSERGDEGVGSVGFVGVPHEVSLDGEMLFWAQVRLQGGPAPVRRFLPHLLDLVLRRKIQPGKVFDLTLPLIEVAERYCARDERRAIKALLTVA
jgi:threonine dehydrogenase-like Zn-dependent dehydrogenase